MDIPDALARLVSVLQVAPDRAHAAAACCCGAVRLGAPPLPVSESEFPARTDPNRKAAFWGAFLPYMQAVKDAGIFKGGAGLEPPNCATTVRVQNGKRSVQDGPYAETKEQLGASSSSTCPISIRRSTGLRVTQQARARLWKCARNISAPAG